MCHGLLAPPGKGFLFRWAGAWLVLSSDSGKGCASVVDLLLNLVSLVIILCGASLVALIPAFAASMPAWLAGRIAASHTPQLKNVRSVRFYWAWWTIFGGLPLAVAIIFGPLGGTKVFVSGPWAIALGMASLVSLNVSAYLIGYQHGLAAKAKREIRLLLPVLESRGTPPKTVDLLDEHHPAIASRHGSDATDTLQLPIVGVDPASGMATPRCKIASPAVTLMSVNEYPTARPHGH